jgi:alpha-mannosidase
MKASKDHRTTPQPISNLETRDKSIAERTGREGIAPEAGLDTSTPMTIHVIPQSHIDVLWYWPPEEGIRMILSTFRGHVEKLESNSDFTYAQSQAYAYDIVRREDPELFSRIQKLVADGRWELVGGEWVEADPVLPGPEARVRQFLFGQLFFQRHFGKQSTVGWCPDGFILISGSLPQILRQAGMRFYIHKRPREKFSQMPITPYRWRGRDGSEVLALRMNNKGNGIPILSEGSRAPLHMGDLSVIAKAFDEIGCDQIFGPMGVGDIGGVNSYELPRTSAQFTLKFSTPTAWFEAMSQKVNPDSLPAVEGSLKQVMTWSLTTWASVKTLNRRAENSLQTAEFLAAIGTLFGLDAGGNERNDAWKDVLFWQDHDSLTGCGTEDILPLVEHGYRQSIRIAERETTRRMRQIAESVQVDFNKGLPVTVFNPLGRGRSDMVSARVTIPKDFLDLVPMGRDDTLTHRVDVRSFVPENGAELEAVDSEGRAVPVMIHRYAQLQKKFIIDVRFLARNLPPMGYRTFFLRKRTGQEAPKGVSVKESRLQTDNLDVTFDLEKGGVERLVVGDVECAAGEVLGRLAIHHTGDYELDYGREHRAWYTGFTGQVDVLSPASHAVRRYSGQRVGVVFEYEYGSSTFQQEFLIEPGVDFIDVTLRGDWREVEKYLKIHFTMASQGEQVAFADLPYGLTDRLPEDAEYPMQYVAGIRDERTVLAIANDSRYGCMWKKGILSLSAIRCATWPARISDRGEFEMRYRIFAFNLTGDDWRRRVFEKGYDVNLVPCAYAQEYSSNQRPATWAFLHTSFDEIMVTCLKPAENGDGLVLRLFNPTDQPARERFTLPDGFARAVQTNLLEEPLEDSKPLVGPVELAFRPCEIKTLLLERIVRS